MISYPKNNQIELRCLKNFLKGFKNIFIHKIATAVPSIVFDSSQSPYFTLSLCTIMLGANIYCHKPREHREIFGIVFEQITRKTVMHQPFCVGPNASLRFPLSFYSQPLLVIQYISMRTFNQMVCIF